MTSRSADRTTPRSCRRRTRSGSGRRYPRQVSRRSWAFDVALAAVVLVWGQLEAWAGVTATHRQGPPAAEAAVYAVTALLLLLRRVNPLGCLAGIVAVSVAGDALFGSPEGAGVVFPALIAAYS